MSINNNAIYTVKFRDIEVTDAPYILSLRLNPAYSKYISKVSDRVEDQVSFINAYKAQNNKESYYFVIEKIEGNTPCGTVRIYNFDNNCFEWGSWILDENKTRYAAMETAIFVYEYAFETLDFDVSRFEVNKENVKVVNFHLKSGAYQIDEDETNYYFQIDKDVALTFVKGLRSKIEKRVNP